MKIPNPFEFANSTIHKEMADVILKLAANGINVFEFVKVDGAFNKGNEHIKYCDALTVNELLLNKHLKVLVLNKEGRVLARNWVV